MPLGLLDAHWQQMGRLEAVESLTAFTRSVVAGDASVKPEERRRITTSWQKDARPRRRRRTPPRTREERLQRLAQLGIAVVMEGGPDGS